MKRILYSFLLFVSVFVNAAAQTNALTTDEDSTINVIAWFNKNDTTEYDYTRTETTIEGNDTTINSNIDEKFRVVVLDSTSDGYRLKFEGLSWKAANANDSLKKELPWKLKSQIPAIFTTNEYGEVKSMENWRSVRNVALPEITKFFDEQYNKTPALDSIMPKKNFLSLIRLGFNSEETLRDQYKEFNSLFESHGNAYKIGITNQEDSTTGYPLHLTTIVSYEDIDTTDAESYYDDYLIKYNAVMTFPATDVTELTNSLLGTILSENMSSQAEKYINDSLNVPMEIRVLTDSHFFYSGWPKLIRKQTIEKLGDVSTRVITETIEWNRFRWNEQDDGDSKTEDSSVSL